jgi:hypothetical protein
VLTQHTLIQFQNDNEVTNMLTKVNEMIKSLPEATRQWVYLGLVTVVPASVLLLLEALQTDKGMTALVVVAGIAALVLVWHALTVWLPWLFDISDRLLTDAAKSVVYDQDAIQAKREREILEHFGGKAEDR